MKLLAAARRFDRMLCEDAYAVDESFFGQFSLYDDSTRDGTTVERRVLSVAPDTEIPSRRVINAAGMTWIVGDKQPDVFLRNVIREKYVAQVVTASCSIRSIQQVLQGAVGVTSYVALNWVKGAKQIEVSSEIFDVYDAFFSPTETVASRSILTVDGNFYIVRTAYRSEAGFLAAVADKIDMPATESVTFSARTYDPLTDTYSSVNSTLTVLRVRWQEHFEYLSRMTETYQRGDMQAMVLKAATPKVNDLITLSDGPWRVLSVIDETTYWSMHMRRA